MTIISLTILMLLRTLTLNYFFNKILKGFNEISFSKGYILLLFN